jgi:hypothetical protein
VFLIDEVISDPLQCLLTEGTGDARIDFCLFRNTFSAIFSVFMIYLLEIYINAKMAGCRRYYESGFGEKE